MKNSSKRAITITKIPGLQKRDSGLSSKQGGLKTARQATAEASAGEDIMTELLNKLPIEHLQALFNENTHMALEINDGHISGYVYEE